MDYIDSTLQEGGGSGGTTNYNDLSNQPSINNVTLTGNKTSEDLALLSADASNLTSTGQKVFDGQWVSSIKALATEYTTAYPKTTDIEYDLSSYLPQDSYSYEVLVSAATKSELTIGKQGRIILKSDIFTTLIFADVMSTSTSTNQYASGTVILPVGVGRKLIVSRLSWANCTYNLWLRGYRRIGTNE